MVWAPWPDSEIGAGWGDTFMPVRCDTFSTSASVLVHPDVPGKFWLAYNDENASQSAQFIESAQRTAAT